MAVEVSTLGIVVKSDGIDEARKALDGGNGRGGLFGAADKTEKAVTKLTDSMSKLVKVDTSAFASAWNSSMSQLSSTISSLNSDLKGMAKALKELTSSLEVVEKATGRASLAHRDYSRSGGVVANTVKAMTTAALAYASVNTVTSIVKQADAWQMMQARLQNATGSLNNARVAQEQMYQLANRLGVPLEETVKLYTRLAPAMQRAGKSSEYAKDMVEGISTALQLGGANGSETSSVMLQLSQSFSSGVLNGAEFNAVAENGSVLMRALEKSTGKSTSELKKMGSQGKLTMEMVGKAIQDNLPEWRKQFDLLPMTFERAMTRLGNAWTKGVGELGQDTGFNKALSEALLAVEKLIPLVLTGLGEAFKNVMEWISKNRDTLDQILASLGLILGQIWEIASASARMTGDIIASGKETSLWAVALTGVAYFVAAISDGMKVIAGTITLMGLAFGKLILLPFQGWLNILTFLVDGFSSFLASTEAGLRAIGKNDAADRMVYLSDQLKSVAERMGDANAKVDTFFRSNAEMAAGWISSIGEGQSAILNLTQKLENADNAAAQLASRKIDFGFGEMDETGWNPNKNPKKPVDAKAAAAAASELKKYEDAMATLTAQYKEQQMLQKNLAERGLDYDKITPGMKKAVELQEKLNEAIAQQADGLHLLHLADERDQALQIARLETENERTKERLTAQKATIDGQTTINENLRKEADELERKVATYGMAKGAVDALALSQAKLNYQLMLLTSDDQRGDGFEARIAATREVVNQMQRVADATGKLGQLDAAKEFDKLFDARKAEKFGNVLAEGFGKAGKSMGLLANAADKYLARQAKIQQGRTLLEKMDKGSEQYAKRNAQLMSEEVESRIASYADMAGAAKVFFKEGTGGYKAMEAAEKAFRLFQMGMQMQSFLQESGLITAITSLFVASKAEETAAEAASVGPHVAAEGAKQGANAITALTSALAAPFPANIPAFAMVAAMLAAIGVAVGGASSGGMSLSEQRQKSQGTGTVFGDSSAKSESISKSLEIVSRNSDIALRYSSGMLSSLQNIEYSLTGATSGVIRTGSAVTGKGYENSKDALGGIGGLGGAAILGGTFGLVAGLATKLPLVGGLVSKLVGGLFGSSSTLKDSGLMGSNQSVGNILQSGFNVSAYQDVQTKKKAFGITYSDKTRTNLSAVDPSVSREFGNIVSGMVDSLSAAAGALGMSGDLVKQKLAAVNIDIGKISLKDLSSEEIQKQLEAVFSAIGDTLAKVALPQVEQFQKSGEGLLETVVRVASGVETASYELDKLGIAAINFNDIINKSGDVGGEIVRQSILMTETGSGIREIIGSLTGTAADIADTYKSLIDVRSSLEALGLGDDVSRGLLRAAGGLEALKSALSDYTDNFFSDSEKTAMKSATLSKEFAKLGLAMPTSKDSFRSLVESLYASGASGQELAAKVLLLSSAFADLTDSTESLVSSARDDLSSAYERESEALVDVRDKFKELAESLKDFKTTLLTGDLSTLDVASKYQVEKAKFEDTLNKARAGDETAIGSFQDVATSFLNASRAMNASGSTYTSDFERVLAETDFISALASGKESVAQQQLDKLDASVKGLIDINTSVMTVAQAIQNLTTLLAGGTVTSSSGPTMKIPEQPAMAQAASVATQSQAELLAQVQALTAEVVALRVDQAAQTQATIAANHDSNMMNAAAIVEGTADVASTTSYAERAGTKLA